MYEGRGFIELWVQGASVKAWGQISCQRIAVGATGTFINDSRSERSQIPPNTVSQLQLRPAGSAGNGFTSMGKWKFSSGIRTKEGKKHKIKCVSCR